MRILLDTQVAIWAMTEDSRLKKRARDIILSPTNIIYYSAVSTVEIELKRRSRSNNLEFTTNQFVATCLAAGYIQLPFKDIYLLEANRLIWEGEGKEHQDPFDRILLAQAIVENMNFLTHDDKISQFRQNCVYTF